MDATHHVIGAGLAGLSTALRLAGRGARVVVHEAGEVAGGRCRTFHDPRLGCAIDNGNHLVLSGNGSARAYLSAIGAEGALVAAPARFAFIDLPSGRRWTVAPGPGRWPFWLLDPTRRVPGMRLRDAFGALALARAGSGETVAEAVRGRGPLWSRFWEPLTLAAVNAPPARASARLLWAVLRETFLKGEAFCQPMLAPRGLGPALVDPAIARLRAMGVEVRFGRALRRVEGEGRASALHFADGSLALGPGDRVILALPPARLRDVLPGLDPPADACAILNAHFRVAPGVADAAPPLIGLIGAAAHWVFRRGDVLSVTISAADASDLMALDAATLGPMLWAETRVAAGLPPGTAPLATRINKEHRATFDQSPAGAARRLSPRTPLANLFLAGDHTATGLPATIEGAIRSGETAAALAA